MSFNQERKRTRGEIACAECRRLKARCDKRVPCSTCVKRGCELLCPNSTMPPGEGSRFVGVAEEFLRRKIGKMEERMRSLEDALAIIQSSASRKAYPLLNEEWPNGLEVHWTPEVNHDPIMESEFNKYGLADALGSLYLDKGAPSDPALFETPGSSESLLLRAKTFVAESSFPADDAEEVDSSYLPSEINLFYHAFPFTPSGLPTGPVQDLIESYLPSPARATALCELFPTVYRHASAQTPVPPRSYGPHDVALLFIVFAIGALMDPSLPPYNVEGQHYHILSRAALCLQPVFTQHAVVTIKTLNLMSIYNGMCGIESKLQNSYSLLNLAAQVALQIGFHQDPSVWGIKGREAYERRTYFWNLLSGTMWQSLIAGRPPVIMPSLIHCHMPTEEEEAIYHSGEVPLGFGTWSFGFITECLIPVVEATQGARPPSYDAVLALDCKIREYSVPRASSNKQMSEQMQAFVRRQLRELTLLFLHRSFFAQALADFPWDPLRSPLRQSFLTAYQSATEVLSTSRDQFAQQPTLCARVWRFWSFAFLAAVIVATVAIKQLLVNLEPEPFGQLDLACTLFHEAARTSVRARKALPILLQLRQEATKVRLETLQYESGKAGNPPEREHHREVRDGRGTFVETSNPLTHHPSLSMPHPGAPSAPSSKYMQALPVPVVHPPLAKIAEPDEEHHAGTIGWPSLYPEISSSESLGLPQAGPFSAPHVSHLPAYGVHWKTSGRP